MAEHCPVCDGALHAPTAGPAWCPACEWQLGAFDARRAPRRWGLRLGDRADQLLAFRLDRRQFAALAGRPVHRRGSTPARLALLLLAAPFALLGPFLVLTGVLLAGTNVPGGVLLGPLLIAAVVAVGWPRRRTRMWQDWTVTPADAPAFFALLDQVAAAAGAPMPHEVRLDHELNASVTAQGLRRRRVLRVGLPLWAALAPQERVALLAHELGHLVNHDQRRGFVVHRGISVLRTLLDLLTVSVRAGSILMVPLAVVATPALWLTSVAMLVLAGRDGQRAEYLADEVAVRVAGSAATASLFDVLLVSGSLLESMAVTTREPGRPGDWRTTAEDLLRRANLPLLAQATQREASLLASHPPAGLRRRMVTTRASLPAQVAPTENEWAAIDASLAPWFGRVGARLGEYLRH